MIFWSYALLHLDTQNTLLFCIEKILNEKILKAKLSVPFNPVSMLFPDTLPPLKKFLKNFEKYKGTDKNGFLQQKILTINRKDI